MHETFTQVLTHKDLSKAGDLFNVADSVIVDDLTDVIIKIKDIASLLDYTRNDNDQSVVEICITRVTSAIRETGSIAKHAEALVSLLHTCLNHNLRPTSRGQDPPHAKIASDVLSCIFLNYQKKQVMSLALPVAVKFLHKGNRELSRNMTSYLSLAAIDAADLLALHVQPILDSIISGNYSLSRVLVQIYSVQKEHIHDHVMTLVSLLSQCETNDKLGLLNLFSLVAKHKPTLLEPSLPQLVDCMTSTETSLATLQIFVELSAKHPHTLTEHVAKLKTVVDEQPHCLVPVMQIIACVGRIHKDRGKYALDYIIENLSKIDSKHLGTVIREVQILCNKYPVFLTEELLGTVNKYSDRVNSNTRECIQQLNHEFNEIRNTNVNHNSGGVTIFRVNGNRDSSAAKSEMSLGGFFAPHVNAGIRSHHKYLKHSDTSKSTGRLVTASNRSMPRLNHLQHSTGRLGSQSNQLNRPALRLGSSHSSIMHHSMTVLSPPSRPLSGQLPSSQMGGSHLSAKMALLFPQQSHGYDPSRVVSSLPGTISPTKSTSSSIATLREIQEQIDRYKKDSVPNDPTYPQMPPLSLPLHLTKDYPSSSLRHSTLPPIPLNSAHQMASAATLPARQGGNPHLNDKMSLNSQTKDCSDSNDLAAAQRISVFEPAVMRDTVQHFCEKHLDKIKAYMQKIFVKLPLPVRCGIEEKRNRKIAKLYFACQGKGDYCLYNKQLFIMKTRNPRIYIHLMFLALQARSDSALSTKEPQVSSLKNCWDILKCENKTFITLVTSAFPSTKDMDLLMHELRNERFFDVFEYNGIEKQWGCFLCNHPERARGFVEENTPVIEGQLKEKKSKWKIFRKWRTRYFTLSGGQLSYRSEGLNEERPHDEKADANGGIEVHLIRSVKVNRNRQIPKAFEIFTEDKSYVLKAKDSSNAEEWVRCLSIAVAHSQTRDNEHSPSRNAHTSIPRNFMYGHQNVTGSKIHV